jgi:hypothetical protein
MANATKGEAGPGLESSYAEFFDENQGGEANKASLLSLINDTINRTPMDLIQVCSNLFFHPCGLRLSAKIASERPL